MAVHFNHESPVVRETFVRGQESIVVECLGSEIVLEFPGTPAGCFRFRDPVDLVFFRNDLERELARDGWTLCRSDSCWRSSAADLQAFGPVEIRH